MTSTTFFIIFIPILAILLLAINLILAPHNPYQEKDSVFECGFHSFLGQNRTQFNISFFIFALLFLLFDLEILLVYPYSVSSYTNDIYGLVIMIVFFVLLTLGFIFELGKNALTIDSRQTSSYSNGDTATLTKMLFSVSPTLHNMYMGLAAYVNGLPGVTRIRRQGNHDLSTISQQTNQKVDAIRTMRDNIINRAELEASHPNIDIETTQEIQRLIQDTKEYADSGVSILAEAMQLIIENGVY
jgi:NADH-ubiquinone oxidoreductase chain 3